MEHLGGCLESFVWVAYIAIRWSIRHSSVAWGIMGIMIFAVCPENCRLSRCALAAGGKQQAADTCQ